MQRKSLRSGFTLPEVLVTVTVVAVLAAVVVPAVTQFSGKGDAPTFANDVNTIRNAATSYIADKKVNPSKVSDLQPYGAGGLTFTTTATTTGTAQTAGYNVVIQNGIDSTTVYNGQTWLSITITTATALCSTLDAAIDGSTLSATSGNFQYSGSDVNPCVTGKVLLVPKST